MMKEIQNTHINPALDASRVVTRRVQGVLHIAIVHPVAGNAAILATMADDPCDPHPPTIRASTSGEIVPDEISNT